MSYIIQDMARNVIYVIHRPGHGQECHICHTSSRTWPGMSYMSYIVQDLARNVIYVIHRPGHGQECHICHTSSRTWPGMSYMSYIVQDMARNVIYVIHRPGHGQECPHVLFKVNFEKVCFQSCLELKNWGPTYCLPDSCCCRQTEGVADGEG